MRHNIKWSHLGGFYEHLVIIKLVDIIRKQQEPRLVISNTELQALLYAFFTEGRHGHNQIMLRYFLVFQDLIEIFTFVVDLVEAKLFQVSNDLATAVVRIVDLQLFLEILFEMFG